MSHFDKFPYIIICHIPKLGIKDKFIRNSHKSKEKVCDIFVSGFIS